MSYSEGGKNPVELDFSASPTMTKQSFKDDVDINRVISRFLKTGQVTGQFRSPGSSVDCSSAVDYKTALGIIRKGEQQFAGLPAKVRARFANNPGNFLAFMENPKNLKEAIELGICPAPKKEPMPTKVILVDEKGVSTVPGVTPPVVK